MSPGPALAIIGLDCAAPSLVFGGLRHELPHLAGLMARGRWGELASTIPPITVPAWMCLATGCDPGQLGLYGFRNRSDYSYGELALASSRDVRAPALWDLAGQAGLTSVVLGVPGTYPPRTIHGALVAGPLTPDPSADFTRPRAMRPLLDRWAEGEYLIDVKGFRQAEPGELASQLDAMAQRRFKVAERLIQRHQPQVFMMVEMSPDRLHHAFWGFHDPTHAAFDPVGPWREVLPQHYRLLDEAVGRLLACLDPQTLVLVVSDHGARPLRGGLAINQWLRAQGWLRLKQPPTEPTDLSHAMIDWPRTRAWSTGGYYARIFLNVAGREQDGVIALDAVDAFKAELTAALRAMPGPDGEPLGNQVFDPNDVYRQVRGVAPDLILYPGGLDYRAVGRVWPDWEAPHFTPLGLAGLDHANHDPKGILIAGRAGGPSLAQAGQEVQGASLLDVLPSALKWLNLPAPQGLAGRAWDWLA